MMRSKAQRCDGDAEISIPLMGSNVNHDVRKIFSFLSHHDGNHPSTTTKRTTKTEVGMGE
eukprot:scaffold3077_cov162-Amphora_coffeaeformis.AAC.26